MFVTLKKQPDREEVEKHKFKVIAKDGGTHPKSSTLSLTINVLDVNDNIPTFLSDSYESHVFENSPRGSRVLYVEAIDRDKGENGIVIYGLEKHLNPTVHGCSNTNKRVGMGEDGNNGFDESEDVDGWNVWSETETIGGPLFRVNETSGEVFTVREIDREACVQHLLQVSARDRSSMLSKSEVVVKIRVDDVNDSPPTITTSHGKGFSVNENAPSGTSVGHLTVIDPDLHDNVRCSTSEKIFAIKQVFPTLFQLSVDNEAVHGMHLDRERQHNYNLTVACVDDGLPALKSEIEVVVNVVDINDNDPVFETFDYENNLLENTLPSSEIMRVSAYDIDEGLNGHIEYAIEPLCHLQRGKDNNPKFLKNKRYSPSRHVRKRRSTYNKAFKHKIKNINPLITDHNDHSELFDVKINKRYRHNKNNAKNIKRFYASHLRIEKKLGRIFLLKPIDREEVAQIRFCVTAYDAGNPPRSSHVEVVINVDDEDDEVG